MNVVSWGRAASACSLALLGLVWFTAGPTFAGQDIPEQRPGCARTITQAQDANAALATASPGDTVCFIGDDLATADLTMIRSGTAAAPIRLVSDGHTTVHQVHIIGDHVIIQGFTISGGDALLLAGTGIIAQKNVVRDTQAAGIVCSPCTDSTIASNTVQRAATTGISISGQAITVRANQVSKTVTGDSGDADGISFFGHGHRIIGNTIWDVSAGSNSGPSQPDCFRTFDTGRAPTFGVVILGNSCQNVAENCLSAHGDEGGNSDAPADSPSITFIGNTCETNGDQAVNLLHWPNVDVRKNRLFGPHLKRAVLITNDSAGYTVRDNTTAGDIPAVEIVDSSPQGSHEQT